MEGYPKGVLVATLVNHAGSGALGAWLVSVINPKVMKWAVVASFALMAMWIFIPDKLDEADAVTAKGSMGVFGTTLMTCFLAGMGDRTQIVLTDHLRRESCLSSRSLPETKRRPRDYPREH
jgi:Ca2+/H+ antiporter, TMEM165/GDT1 family